MRTQGELLNLAYHNNGMTTCPTWLLQPQGGVLSRSAFSTWPNIDVAVPPKGSCLGLSAFLSYLRWHFPKLIMTDLFQFSLGTVDVLLEDPVIEEVKGDVCCPASECEVHELNI